MCGIAGIFSRASEGAAAHLEALHAATDRLRQRGPDSFGYWHDALTAFGHRRLRILDLSANGHQPMLSHDGRWVITFNGEIYNFQEIRADLEREGVAFRSTADTEVLLEGFARWGHEKLLPRLSGMFAFAIWDTREQTLFLARDRFGVKPLVYFHDGQRFAFASTLSSLAAFPFVPREIDPKAVALYLQTLYVPSDLTIYRGVRKFPAGGWMKLDARGHLTSGRYWQPPPRHAHRASEPELLAQFDRLLDAAVERRLVADVPVGVFLSGGIDSSLVAAYAARKKPKIQTFTISFPGTPHDEAAVARRIARHLGTDHHEEPLTAAQALARVGDVAREFDEPFADVSAIPTMLLSEATRKHVTVALSGDGGDELYGGYRYYRLISAFIRIFGTTPAAFRRLAARAPLKGLPHSLRLAQGALEQESIQDVYAYMRNALKEVRLSELMPGRTARTMHDHFAPFFEQWSPTDPASYCVFDFFHYLKDDVLVKVDRASMAHSLEVRSPFLDLALTEWAMNVPFAAKVQGSTSKALSRRLLSRYLPEEITRLPKKGFEVPIRQWFRGPLAGDVRRMAAESDWDRFQIDRACVKRLADEHIAGARNHELVLWSLWMLQSWADTRDER